MVEGTGQILYFLISQKGVVTEKLERVGCKELLLSHGTIFMQSRVFCLEMLKIDIIYNVL